MAETAAGAVVITKKRKRLTIEQFFSSSASAASTSAEEEEQSATDRDAKYCNGGLRRDVNLQLEALRAYIAATPGLLAEMPALYNIRRVGQVPFTVAQKYPDLLKHLVEAAMARPKPKYFQKRISNPPWKLYLRDSVGVCIPRALAITLFGPTVPEKTHVWEGEPLRGADGSGLGTPVMPLRGPEQCKGNDNVNQQALVEAVVQELQTQVAMQKFGGTIYCIPPGKGKTGCAMHIISRLGRKALFVVPNLNLIPQTKKEVEKFLGPHARAGHLSTSDPKKWKTADCDVVVASLKSVLSCDYDLSEYGTVVVDEVHETCTKGIWPLFTKFANKYVVGITATPERRDETGGVLEWLIGPICWFQSIDLKATRWGEMLVRMHDLHYHPDVALQIVNKRVGKEIQLDLEVMYEQLATHAGRANWLAELVAKMARDGRQVLCLGQRIALMKNLTHALKERGVDVGLLVGESNRDEKMSEEEVDAVRRCQVRVFTDRIGYKALDVPELDTLVVLDPACKGIDSWLQRLGRLTRDYAKPLPEIHFLVDHGVPSFVNRAEQVVRNLFGFSDAFCLQRANVFINS